MPLSAGGGEFFEWSALRRVAEGKVTTVDRSWFHRGQPMHPEYTHALRRLLDGGCLGLHPPDTDGHQQVSVTIIGDVRAEQLGGT